uniref:OSJNBa0042L16.4 protein n=1 Tax=Oryza sativa subsp. japonica TaxID=39947 RepID=Q7XT90_ORYSJ|nr:OSJNBa0042L16.4 [Oryza sativa Japonica Group]
MDGENPSFSRCIAVVVSSDKMMTSSGGGRCPEPGEADEELVSECSDGGEDGGEGTQRKSERVRQQVEWLAGAKEDERSRIKRPEPQRQKVKETPALRVDECSDAAARCYRRPLFSELWKEGEGRKRRKEG